MIDTLDIYIILTSFILCGGLSTHCVILLYSKSYSTFFFYFIIGFVVIYNFMKLVIYITNKYRKIYGVFSQFFKIVSKLFFSNKITY